MKTSMEASATDPTSPLSVRQSNGTQYSAPDGDDQRRPPGEVKVPRCKRAIQQVRTCDLVWYLLPEVHRSHGNHQVMRTGIIGTRGRSMAMSTALMELNLSPSFERPQMGVSMYPVDGPLLAACAQILRLGPTDPPTSGIGGMDIRIPRICMLPSQLIFGKVRCGCQISSALTRRSAAARTRQTARGPRHPPIPSKRRTERCPVDTDRRQGRTPTESRC